MDSCHKNPRCSFCKVLYIKYSCISCNISVCNICSTTANIESDKEKVIKIEKFFSRTYKDNPLILKVSQIQPMKERNVWN